MEWLILPGNWGKNLFQRRVSQETAGKGRPEASVSLLRHHRLSAGAGTLVYGGNWDSDTQKWTGKHSGSERPHVS